MVQDVLPFLLLPAQEQVCGYPALRKRVFGRPPLRTQVIAGCFLTSQPISHCWQLGGAGVYTEKGAAAAPSFVRRSLNSCSSIPVYWDPRPPFARLDGQGV